MPAIFSRARYPLRLPRRILVLGERTLIMGVLNITPDSFFSGGRYPDSQEAVARAFELQQAGADILDIGGESTRPGADPISDEEELARILPVIEGLQGKLRIPISVDTQKAHVAEAALAAGAEIVNDISSLRTDSRLGEVVRRRRAALILMHMRGVPKTMHKGPFAPDVMRDVTQGLRGALVRAENAGLPRSRLLIDPGIGFGKNHEQSCEVLARLRELARLGCPIVVGTSRKTFIGWALAAKGQPWPPENRQWGTAATVAAAILGGAHVVRVHDVIEMAQIARVTDAIVAAGKS